MANDMYDNDARYRRLIASAPSSQNIQDMYTRNNQLTKQEPIKQDSLLAAGLGAGTAFGAALGNEYMDGKQAHAERISALAAKYKEQKIDPLESKATGFLSKVFKPKESKAALDKQIDLSTKLKKGWDHFSSKEELGKRGLKAVKSMPKGKALIATGGGALLGMLANKILSNNEDK